MSARWERPFHERSGLSAAVRLYAFGTTALGNVGVVLRTEEGR